MMKGYEMNNLGSFVLTVAWAAISLTGCGGDDGGLGPPPPVITKIQSDPGFDGDIEQKSPITFLVT